MQDDEYELVPLSPVRKVEKRLEKLERTGTSADLIKELISVVRTNQEVIDDVVKINSDMITRISELSNSVNAVTNKINDFLSRIEVSGREEIREGNSEEEGLRISEMEKKTDARLAKMEKRVNALLLSTMAKRPRPPMRRQ